jgi:putative integral membrane protein (TIGR02587 family)
MSSDLAMQNQRLFVGPAASASPRSQRYLSSSRARRHGLAGIDRTWRATFNDAAPVTTDNHLRETAVAYARGVAGALLVGMPTLMTMEMWWGGFTISSPRLLLLLATNFGVLLVLQHYSGLHPRKTRLAQLRAAIVAAGMGLVMSACILLVLGVLRHDTVFRDAIGKIALETIPVSIGASVAASEFENHSEETERRREGALLFPSLGIGLAGAMIFGFNVAATEEPMVIGEQLTWMHAIAIVVLSLLIVFGISYSVGKRRLKMEPLSREWIGFYVREAIATYVLSLGIGAYVLWTFGRIGLDTNVMPSLHMILALGLVTTLGATAAELLV